MMTEHEVITGMLEREGWPAITNRAADRGGWTKGGVTIDTLSAHRGYRVTVQELAALEEPEARVVYATRHVRPWQWLPDERLRLLLADWSVTSWHDDPARALQRAVGASVDGAAGPETRGKTLAALEAGQGDQVYREVLAARIRFYIDLALEDPPMRPLLRVHKTMQIHNLRGWVNRTLEFL